MEILEIVELARYVAVISTNDMIEGRGLSEVIMARKKTWGGNPRVTGTEMDSKWRDKCTSLFSTQPQLVVFKLATTYFYKPNLEKAPKLPLYITKL